MKPLPSRIEALEARIAPALLLSNPLFDILGGAGQIKQSVDLSKMFDAAATSRTHVTFLTNVDMDAATAGLQAGVIEIELLDDVAPLTVQNFVNYVNAKSSKGDYDDTIIHRQADFNGNGTADFIQGGGFEYGNLDEHIPTGVNLHNEYSMPNVRGTIAMGKVGGDPHSASSEWFINAEDNSTIFGVPGSGTAQGYTVFGNVLSGMDVVDKIAELDDFDLSQELDGPFSQLPLQGGYSDGSGSVDPIPTAEQFVRITDVFVVPGNSTGVTFSAQAFEPGTATPSTLLKTAVKGSKLELTYSGRAGVADVVVTGRDAAGAPTTDTFTVTLAPNLIAEVADDGLQTLMVPGDTGTMKINITNSGSANLKTNVKVEFYLSQIGANGDTDGTTLDAGDTLLTTVPSKALSLAPGKTALLSQTVSIPAKLVENETPVYRILTKVTPLTAVDQLNDYTDDDVARLSDRHGLSNQFGTFSINASSGPIVRTGAVLKFTQDDGVPGNVDPFVTLSMKGSGSGHIATTAAGVLDLDISGTNLKSSLTALVGKGQPHLQLNDLNATTPLGTAALGLVDFDGFVSFSAGVKTATLGDLIGHSTFTLGALLPDNATKATIKLGRVQDYSFEGYQPIASLTAIEWLDVAGFDDTIDALSIDKLTITGAKGGPRGDFEANVELSGVAPLATLTVAGFLKNSTVHTPGDIGKVTLGGIDHSNIFAGTAARPDALADFTDERTIASFTIKGITGVTDLFIDSQIAAQNIGTISVRGVDTDSGASDFGFVADAIKSYNRLGGAKGTKLEGPGVTDRADDYLVQLL